MDQLIFIIISFVFSLSVHESAHGLAAYLLGDPTAKNLGRISLNPLRHLDPLGTLLIFFVGFGWGKPVPIDDRYFKNKKRDNALSALAGPLSNIFLALCGFVFLKHIPLPQIGYDFLDVFISLNLILAVFNFLPVPPLDGSHIIEFFLPKSWGSAWTQVQQTAPFLLLALLLAEHFFNLGIITTALRFLTDILYAFLYSLS